MKKIWIFLIVVIFSILISVPVFAAPDNPLLQINSVTFSPETVTPGASFTMNLEIVNHGNRNAYNTKVDVVSLAGIQDLGIFSMSNSGNHFYVGKIPSDEVTVLSIPMVAAPAAEAKNYNLNLQITTENGDGAEFTFPETVGVFVNESASMTMVSSDEINGDSKEGENLKIDVANLGANTVKGVRLNLSGENLTIANQGIYYGTFEKNVSDTFSTNVTGNTPGEHILKAKLTYVDSFNKERTIEKDIKVTTSEENAKTEVKKNEDNFLIKIVKVIFGVK